MALDSTAREANFKDSMKKYLVDNLWTVEQIPLSFDASLANPLTPNNAELRKWVNVRFADLYRDDMSLARLELRCCTRGDNEGFTLAQLCDKVIGYLTTTDDDGIKRITFYKSYPSPTAWENIGGIVIQDIYEGGVLTADDGTMFKILYVTCRFASKI